MQRRKPLALPFYLSVIILNQSDETGGVAAAAALADAPWSDTLQNKERIAITSRVNAAYALHNLDIAISAISSERAKYGAYIGRLEYAGDNLTNVARHQEQSRSRIADADYAVETTQLSRTTIIAQASTAMLAQANASKQSVLTLLQ
jgi:flagellin